MTDGKSTLDTTTIINWTIGGLIAALLVVNALTWLKPGQGSELIGKPAPELTLPAFPSAGSADPAGKVALSDLRGKVVLMDFWATWCPPCHKQMVQMVRLQKRRQAGDFVILSVNVNEPEKSRTAKVRGTLRRYDLAATTVMDDGRAQRLFGVTSYPTLVVIAPDGTVERVASGVHSAETLESWIKEASNP